MQIIDLSQIIENGMPVYAGDPQVKIEKHTTITESWWNVQKMTLWNHTGAHVDAPSHVDDTWVTIDELHLDAFMGESICIWIHDDYPKSVWLVFWEWSLTMELAEKLTQVEPQFVVVWDDAELSEDLEKYLLRRGIITYTDLVNISALPRNKSFMFYGVPLKIAWGSWSPVRAFAILSD